MSETKEPIVLSFIEGDIVSLCPANADHINLYASWMNNPVTRKYARFNMPQTIDELKKMFEPRKEEVKEDIFFEIWHKKDNKPVGYANLFRIQWFTRNANIFILIDPEYWGKNIGTEAGKLVLDYAYKELNLHKITARMFEPNKASLRIAKKIGFKHEITLKKEVYIDGEHLDVLEYVIFKDDWMSS
ncbi:MAG: GNAT family N-acetyltransferase [Promethearchaeota archaeon]|nr:MAG: GNAT family N-acetyltransferase [Candidatus Lokiarchaeota archaeon]